MSRTYKNEFIEVTSILLTNYMMLMERHREVEIRTLKGTMRGHLHNGVYSFWKKGKEMLRTSNVSEVQDYLLHHFTL